MGRQSDSNVERTLGHVEPTMGGGRDNCIWILNYAHNGYQCIVDRDLDVTSAVLSQICMLNYAYYGYRCIVDRDLDATSAVLSQIWIMIYAYSGY